MQFRVLQQGISLAAAVGKFVSELVPHSIIQGGTSASNCCFRRHNFNTLALGVEQFRRSVKSLGLHSERALFGSQSGHLLP
jgi:hypothetical protein